MTTKSQPAILDEKTFISIVGMTDGYCDYFEGDKKKSVHPHRVRLLSHIAVFPSIPCLGMGYGMEGKELFVVGYNDYELLLEEEGGSKHKVLISRIESSLLFDECEKPWEEKTYWVPSEMKRLFEHWRY